MSASRLIHIGTCLARAETWNPLRSPVDDVFRYIDLSSVDQNTKTISDSREVACAEAPSRARQLVSAGDVLVSTVRPNLNGVARVPSELDGATASTGFCVLRPEPKTLDGSYLFQWVKSSAFISDMVSKATGASYPAVSDRIIFESAIPLPPLEEQRRIAAILDQADALRAKRREALTQLDSLTQSIFIEMFGDPATNEMGWSSTKIERLADQVTDGEHLTPKRETSGIKLLSARNVRDGFIDYQNVDFVGPAEHERIKKRCNPVRGDVLISCSGSIGRVASVETDEPFSLVRSVAMIRPKTDLVYTKFLEYYLRTPAMNAYMIRRANASSQANLFQGPIREMPVLLPPLPLQQAFTIRVKAVEALKTTHRAAVAELDTLFASLQHRAFAGQL